jgi:hypothetical protein
MTTPSPFTLASVDDAVIQQAIDELNIGVPVRGWTVRQGHLVLFLAYGGAAHWIPPELRPDPTTGQASDAALSAAPIPDDLDTLLKRDLQLLAGLHAVPDWQVLLKAELIAALAALRDHTDPRSPIPDPRP